MKICVSSYSFHYAFENDLRRTLWFPGFCAAEYGVKAIEFFDQDFFCGPAGVPALEDLSKDHPYVRDIAEACTEAGVAVAAISAQNDFTHPDDDKRAQDIRRVRKWLEIAPEIHAKTIRINSGNWFQDPSGRTRLCDALRELAPEAHKRGVSLAIENHPRDLQSVGETKQLLEIVEEFIEYGVAACPDNGHIAEACRFECLDLLMSAASHCHVKFYEFDARGHETTLAYGRFFEVAEKNDFNGTVSVENVNRVASASAFLKITDRTIEELRRKEVTRPLADKLLEGAVFKSRADLRSVLVDLLPYEQVLEAEAKVKSLGELVDPNFERYIELTRMAVAELEERGASL